MQLTNYTQWLIVALICVFLNSCAITHGTGASTSKSEQAELHLKLGMRYLEMNMLRIAKERLELAYSMDAKNEKTNNALGVLHERIKQFDIAGKYYKQAITLDADNESISNNYGRFLCERGDVAAGMDLLNQTLAMPLNTRKWYAYTNLGRCELREGLQDQAEGHFRQALEENNQYSPALFEMQKISYRKGKYMSARAFLQRYLLVSKHSAETLWFAVQTEKALGNKQLSEEYQDKLFNQFSTSKEALQLKSAINQQ